jgi:hypothetical protein
MMYKIFFNTLTKEDITNLFRLGEGEADLLRRFLDLSKEYFALGTVLISEKQCCGLKYSFLFQIWIR